MPSAVVHLPDIRDLAEQVRFTPDTGRIWVRDQRGVLLTASVYGALRRELIDRLGPAATRELLSRIGYAEGGRDAETARRLRPAVNYFDAFAVGPQVHALAGFGWSEVVHLNAEPESGAFAGEFLVHDSLEAATHLDAYGQSPEPVCWMQSGYASGFASAFAGRPILMREVECRGMGHEACRLIGKPLDEEGVLNAGYALFVLPPWRVEVSLNLLLLLRKAAERTKEAVWRRIGSLLDQFTPQECQNYIRNAGYGSV